MFSYCKRGTKRDDKYTEEMFNYYVNPLKTIAGFGKNEILCNNIQMPFVYNRGLPRNLLDLEAKLKGQDSSVQPFCSNADNEDVLQFSTLGWIQDQPIPKGPIPCAPVPMVQVKAFSSFCQDTGLTKPCGERCDCGRNCQCGSPAEMNRNRTTKPELGLLPMTVVPACKF